LAKATASSSSASTAAPSFSAPVTLSLADASSVASCYGIARHHHDITLGTRGITLSADGIALAPWPFCWGEATARLRIFYCGHTQGAPEIF
jgi:hypothetical protein